MYSDPYILLKKVLIFKIPFIEKKIYPPNATLLDLIEIYILTRQIITKIWQSHLKVESVVSNCHCQDLVNRVSSSKGRFLLIVTQ